MGKHIGVLPAQQPPDCTNITGPPRAAWRRLIASRAAGVAVIRAAMDKKHMVALGRLVMSTRERVCAIEIEEGGLVLTTLRTAEEVRDMAELPSPDLPKPDPQMLAIAEKIVDQQSGDFDPAEFTDRYEDALRALIEEKKKGKKVKPTAAANDDDGKVIDLMAALKKSLQGGAGKTKKPTNKRVA